MTVTSANPNLPTTGDLFNHLDFGSAAGALPDELADEFLPRSVTLFEHYLIHLLQEVER